MARRKQPDLRNCSPIELKLRNALIEQARDVQSNDLMIFDYSTSKKPAIGVIDEKGRLIGVKDHETWEIPGGYFMFGDGSNCWSLYADVRIDRYRADFLIFVDSGDICVAVECDG